VGNWEHDQLAALGGGPWYIHTFNVDSRYSILADTSNPEYWSLENPRDTWTLWLETLKVLRVNAYGLGFWIMDYHHYLTVISMNHHISGRNSICPPMYYLTM
jgi:hypothetical protein